MEDSKIKTCIIYCRVSSREQVEGTSLENQRQYCLKYAEDRGYKVAGIFVDEGESAKTADRPQFNKAIAHCSIEKGKVDFFIVYKLDRFARNRENHVTIQALLKRHGTFLRSVTEPVDESAVGKLMDAVISGVAEFDNSVRAERTRAGMMRRVQEGIWVWPVPLGYHRPFQGKGMNIAPHPETSPLIRMCFEEYSKGTHTYRTLAQLLSKHGLKTREGKNPSPQLINKILRNPVYYGRIDSMGIICIGSFEPIISEKLFLACQKDQKIIKPRSANNPKFPLRKFIMCSDCGAKLTGSSSSGKKGKKYAYYHHGAIKCAKAISIPKETFEQQFVEFLESLTPSKKYEKLFKAVVLDLWQEKHKQADAENAKLQHEIDKLREDRQRIFDYHRNGTYDDNDFRLQKKIIDDQIDRKYALARKEVDAEFEMNQALEYYFNSIKEASSIWLRASYEQKIRLQRLILEKPLVFDGEKFGNPELTVVLQQKKTPMPESSSLVAPRGIEPLFSP